MTPEEEAELLAEWVANESAQKEKAVKDKIDALWKAADAHIFAYINGAGLSILASGTQLGKPKAKAFSQWIDAVWAEYYKRKALVTADNEPDLDFSNFGAIPHTVLELREEVSHLWTT